MGNRVTKGVSWSAIQQFSTQIIQFLTTIVLARLLTPEQFGIVAVATILLNILQIINETGFGAALMQKLDRDETDFFSVFILNIFMGIILYSIIFFTAPLWAILFKSPQATPVIRLIGLNLIIGSFIVVQRTKLLIKVDFKTWTIASLSAAIISGGIGIFLAFKGYGVYSLVYQSLLMSFISTVLIWVKVKWTPNMQFSFKRLKSLFKFAYKLILARLVNTLYNQIYSSVIAIFFNPAQLAFFNRANSFEAITTSNIVGIVQRVAVPVMCEVQKSEDTLRHTLLKFIHYTAFIITPLITIIFLLSDQIIVFLLTDKWLESAKVLRIIAIVGFFYNISAFNMNLYNATGRTDLALKCEIVKKIISIIIVGVAIFFQNFYLLVWSYTICTIVECIINVKFTYPLVHISFFKELLGLKKIIICAFVMGIYIYALTFISSNIYFHVFGISISSLIIYFISCAFFNVCNSRIIMIKILAYFHLPQPFIAHKNNLKI